MEMHESLLQRVSTIKLRGQNNVRELILHSSSTDLFF